MNKKNRMILILLVAAIIVAAAAAMAVYMYLTPQKTTIYMFNSNYSAGETVSTEMLTTITVDAKIMAGGRSESTGGRFVTSDDIRTVLLKGNVLRMDVAAGMPLTYAMLSVSGGSSVETYMDPTKIAVTVAVNNITGVTNDLKDGSRVNVYVPSPSGDGVTLFLQSMMVLSATSSGGVINSVTLECDQNQALKLVYAATYSSIYLGLVNASSYSYVADESSYSPLFTTDVTANRDAGEAEAVAGDDAGTGEDISEE